MTLQEKIQKKAEEYGKLAPAFLEGAKFALENQWISVEDDLPCNISKIIHFGFTNKVLVIDEYKNIFITYFFYCHNLSSILLVVRELETSIKY